MIGVSLYIFGKNITRMMLYFSLYHHDIHYINVLFLELFTLVKFLSARFLFPLYLISRGDTLKLCKFCFSLNFHPRILSFIRFCLQRLLLWYISSRDSQFPSFYIYSLTLWERPVSFLSFIWSCTLAWTHIYFTL